LRWLSQRQQRAALWHLKHLGTDEVIILKEFLKQNKAVGYFDLENGAVSCLIAKGVLIHASSIFTSHCVPVAIHPCIVQFLKKHPHLVGLKTEEIGTEKPAEKATTRYPEHKLSRP
ncbi:MAG TPA: super-infection exclusion protein B, partial [Candidatus Limnocylindrales bacterium]|nr:super-infection exclusion protein B [Candidatus Limnocylindrales bacterium]